MFIILNEGVSMTDVVGLVKTEVEADKIVKALNKKVQDRRGAPAKSFHKKMKEAPFCYKKIEFIDYSFVETF